MKLLSLLYISTLVLSCHCAKTTTSKKDVATVVRDNKKDTIPNTVFNTPHNINDTTYVPKVDHKVTNDNLPTQDLEHRFLGLHQLWNDLLQKHVTDEGKVNYKGFKADHYQLNNYIKSLDAIKMSPDFVNFSNSKKLAYWINTYNAFTVDLIVRNYPVTSIKDIKNPWKQRLWKLGEKWYNLDEIEHQIIRKMNEPRIHFALVCAAQSCPKLYNKAFTEDNLDSTLTTLTKAFLADPSKNNISEKHIKLSKIFKWFTKDFKTNGTLIDFLNKYTEVSISEHAKTSYLDYNWNLNE